MDSEKYIGLDVHQATIVVAVLDWSGKLVMESILETEAATILQFFARSRCCQRDFRLCNSGRVSLRGCHCSLLCGCRCVWDDPSANGTVHFRPKATTAISTTLIPCPKNSLGP